jgi:eukaryotic-like serine/threonine-protein kinase
MTSDKWRTTWDLYSSARELPPAERDDFLSSASTDPEVLQEVSLLLNQPDEEPPEAEQNHTALLASFGMGRYTVIGYLGKGGMSEVYSAQDQQLGRTVALKFLLPGTIGSRSAERVMREAKTLSALNHPNIVTVYEVIQSPSGLAMVMELVEGTALRSLCGDPLPEEHAVRFGLQIAQALAAAHAHDIVHHDIKPENILVRPDGYIKVVDFGLARQFSPNDATSAYGLTVGTLRYMSPEQVQGKPISSASDIFSLGLVLYELTAGEHPFASDSSVQTAYSIATKPFALPVNRPTNQLTTPRLEKLIVAMLVKDPTGRPSALTVAKELDEILLLSGSVALRRTSNGKRRLSLAGLVACLLGVSVVEWLAHNRRDAPVFSDLKIQPLTSQAGWGNAPALSPDGQSIAFTWADKLDGVRNIYIQGLSQDDPVKLTNNSNGLIGYPAWSPNGKHIAFKYVGKGYGKAGGSLYSISISDGRQQKLLDLVNADVSSSIDWSPDGTELAFSDALPGTARLGLHLLDLRTGKTRRLTSPPKEFWGDWDPKFSPDGSTIAFKRVTGFWVDDMYLVAQRGGTPRRLTSARRGIWGHAWLPDGKSLIVSCQRTGSIFGIWRFPAVPDAKPERISLGGIDAITPTTSRRANNLAWVSQLWDLNIYRIPSDGSGKSVRLIASTLRDQGATYSSDGRIAFVSDRSGSREIWLANQDGSGQVRVTNLKGPPIDDLQWSPDGRQLAFESQASGQTGIFVLECRWGAPNCGTAKRVTPIDTPAESPAWSMDGRSLYFASEATGRWEVWRAPASGGQMAQITQDGGYTARESPDGKWLYFSKSETEAIFRRPLPKSGDAAIAETELVIGSPYRVQPGGWALTRKEVVFIDRTEHNRPPAIRAYNLETKSVRLIASLSEVFADRSDIGLSVSPDEKWILYSQLDRSGSNIILAESR